VLSDIKGRRADTAFQLLYIRPGEGCVGRVVGRQQVLTTAVAREHCVTTAAAVAVCLDTAAWCCMC
jgi:hypothetical protein